MLKRFVKDLVIYMPSQFLPAITAFITTPILTRMLLPDEFGYWALASSISSFLVAIAASGLGSAVVRYYPAYKSKDELDSFWATMGLSVNALIALVAIVGFVVLFFFKGILPPVLEPYLPIVILIYVTDSLFTVLLSAIRVQHRSGSYTTFRLLVKYGGLGIGIALVYFGGFRVEGLLLGTFAINLILLPPLAYLATDGKGIHPKRFLFADALQMMQYAWPLTLANVAMWGLRVSDLFIIRLFGLDREVGLYSVSYDLSAKSIELLVMLFLLSVSPFVMNTWENEGQTATENALSMMTRVYLILCLPAAVGLSVLAFPFVSLLTAPEYHEGASITGFIVFSSFLWGLAQISMMGTQVKKDTLRLGVNTVVAALTHIVLQLLLVPQFGYRASAISTLVGYSVLLLLNVQALRRHFKWKFPYRTLINVGIASIAMGFFAWWIYTLTESSGVGPSFIHLLLSIFAAVLFYFGCVWVIGEIKPEEKASIWRILLNIIKKDSQSNGSN